jgi:pilus assembly protein CpaB
VASPLSNQPRSADLDGAAQASGGPPDAAEPAAEGAERRRHPRIRVETGGIEAAATELRETERRQGERRQGERRQGDRRQSGGLRDNVGWTVAADRGARLNKRLQFGLKKSRIVVLGIAIVAGGIAAYLANQIGRPPEAAPAAVAAPAVATTEVLVASQHIAAGQRLSASSLAWQAWPERALQSDYITVAATPEAKTDMSGFMARSEFLPGDPIRRQKLTEGAGGFLSAALDKGMRGVSVVVTAESASGGFISPGDRVDVVLTRSAAGEISGRVPRSETILHNVPVLAINSKVVEPGSLPAAPDEQRSNTFDGQAIATLALDPTGADLVVSAAAMGKLSLLLRSVVDAAGSGKESTAPDSADQAIRMSSRFWLE